MLISTTSISRLQLDIKIQISLRQHLAFTSINRQSSMKTLDQRVTQTQPVKKIKKRLLMK